METATAFPTTPLLRPDQAEAAREEIKSLEAKLQNKHIEDKAEVGRQLNRARRDLQNQLPRPPETTEEEGRMAARSKELLSQIIEGMPSQEEMRKAPPGAVDKHMRWERRNKARILEWKHIMLRMTAGSGDREVANIERYRPTASTLNMDNAVIPGKQFFIPPMTTGLPVTFSDEQMAVLRQLSPDVAERLCSMTNEQRADVKAVLNGGSGIGLTAPEKPKRKMSDAQKAALAEGRARAKAAKGG